MNHLLNVVVRFFERWMPDSFVVAIVLTLLTFTLAIGTTDTSAWQAIGIWNDGLWSLLTFTNQIALTLLLGYALATTAVVRKLLLRIASRVRSARSAYMTVCIVTGIFALASWSLALVAAGIMSRAVGEACQRRGVRVHYPLLVASAFTGFIVWHQGLSGSIPLTLATPGHFLEAEIGIIPTSATLFTAWNLITVVAIMATLPWVMAWMHPKDDAAIQEMPAHLLQSSDTNTNPAADEPSSDLTPAERLERSRLLAVAVVVIGALALFTHFIERGNGLTLNAVNLALLTIGLCCAGTFRRYTRALIDGGAIVVPFLIQYPFYAAIAALIAHSGLAQSIVTMFTSVASADTLPLLGLLSAGLLNIFIPSGGAQWVVQGPIMIAAAQELGADPALTAMSVALGDQWTNLIQPLILLPVLTVASISVRSVMGYLFMAMLWAGVVFIAVMMMA